MDYLEFPNCCTLKIVAGLGGSSTAEFGGRPLTKHQVREGLRGKENRAKRSGMAALVVTTTTEQKVANKVLRQRGYRCTPWMNKEEHPETKLRIWWKPVEEMK